MFFLVRWRRTYVQKNLDHRIELHPSFFGPSMVEFRTWPTADPVNRKLRDDVEGTCSGKCVRAACSLPGLSLIHI